MRPCLAPALLLACACATAPVERPLPQVLRGPSRAEPLRLAFRPPEGEALGEVARLVLREDGEVRQRVELRLRSTFTRHGEGWRLSQQPAPRADGGSVRGAPLEVELTHDGTFVRLVNAQQLAAALGAGGPGATAGGAEAEALEADARREWDARYGQLLGRSLRQGDTLYSVDAVPTPAGGTVTFLLARTVVGTRATPHGEALVLGLRCLGSARGLPGAQVGPALEAAGSPALEPSVACEGEQVLGTGAFRPLSTRLALTARPRGADGREVPVQVERSVELTGEAP